MNIFNHGNIATFIILLSGGISFLLSIGELFVRNRRMENYIFWSLLLFYSIIVFQICCIAEGIVLYYPHLFYFHLTFLYIIAPLGYFAYFLTVLPSEKLPIKKIMLFFVPSFIAFSFDMYYLMMPSGAQRALIESLFYSGTIWHDLPFRIMFAGHGLLVLIYLGLLLFRFIKTWTVQGQMSVLVVSIAYLAYTIITTEMTIAGYILPSRDIMKWGCCLISFVVPSAFLVSQRLPKFMQLIIEETGKGYYANSRIAGLDVERIIGTLNDCMVEKEMFLDEELSLKDMADELSITSHQLSQIINERLSTNFKNYVNQYRVEYAKKLLLTEPESSVISVAFAAGFNSKASFYNSFSRFTGKNPKKFRKENA